MRQRLLPDMAAPHLAHSGPKIADCVEGTGVREYLDPFEA